MGSGDIETAVLGMLSRVVRPQYLSKVAPVADLRADLGLDSLTLMSLLFTFEQAFGVEVPPENLELSRMRTVGDFISLARGLRGGSAA